MLNRNVYDSVDSPSLNPPQDRCFEPVVAIAERGIGHFSGTAGAIAPKPGPKLGRSAKSRSLEVPQPQVNAEKVVQAFNTWAFKREQPSDSKLLLETVARSIARSEPIPFVMYWGKGPRCQIDAPDIACLDHLAAFSNRIRAIYARGAAIRLILTDTHAQLNGHLPRAISRYFADIDVAARQHGFETCWLGDLTRAAGHQAESDPADETVLTSDMLATLAKSAMKWYRGEGTAEDGARTYYRINMVERRAVEFAFPTAIFMTFNGSKARWLFPEHMPIFYMYSLRRGFSVKPWFLPAEASPCDAASCRCATPPAA